MRLVSFREPQQHNIQWGVDLGGEIFVPNRDPRWQPNIDSMLTLIDAGSDALVTLTALLEDVRPDYCVAMAQIELLAPIPRPRQNVICLGLNYQDHVAETATEQQVKLPRSPVVFTKAANSVNGPYADIEIDTSVSAKMDWEVELAVIIGKTGMSIAEHDALDHVFGYTVLNDVTARDRQKWHKQFYIGKSYRGCCPMGPAIVTADEITDPHNLNIFSRVNGELKQSSNTVHQIFSIAHVIAILSQGMELEAGDIIATGTPSGVGYARTPPEYLMPGDVVECEVEHIGKITNSIKQRHS
ncbi:MAG: FAA hydrolase family protein [Candidatus Thioglobus sp.]|nr:MAG: FAA hydrolase family protein [Candidatus Thioglobus sp.]